MNEKINWVHFFIHPEIELFSMIHKEYKTITTGVLGEYDVRSRKKTAQLRDLYT